MPIDLPPQIPENRQVALSDSYLGSLFDERVIRVGWEVRAVVAPKFQPSKSSGDEVIGGIDFRIPSGKTAFWGSLDSVGQWRAGMTNTLPFQGGQLQISSLADRTRASIEAVMSLRSSDTTIALQFAHAYDGSEIRELIKLTFAGISQQNLGYSGCWRVSGSLEQRYEGKPFKKPWEVSGASITFRRVWWGNGSKACD